MTDRPVRLQRTRKRLNFTPNGAIYVGRPTWWANPFQARPRIGHSRSVILYRAWLDGNTSPYILARCGFGPDEVAALDRWRAWLLGALHKIRGANLQCWCPLSSAWCHADVLLSAANAERLTP